MSNYIFDFIRSLNKAEIKSVQDYLKFVSDLSSSSVEDALQSKLFNLLTDENSIIKSEDEVAQKIGTKNISSLKNELAEKVAEALTLNRHINNNSDLDNRIENVYKLKKKILFLRIIARSNNKSRAEFVSHLFSEIILQAKKYEVYDVLVEALTFQKYFKGIRSGKEEFDKINNEIEFYEECNKSVWFATDCYHAIILNNDLVKTFTNEKRLEFVKKSIKDLEKQYKYTQSYQVLYFSQILKFAYFEELNQYKKAIQECEKLIEILKESHVIFSKERLGFANDNLARYHAYEDNYKKAIKTAQLAQDFYNEDTFMYLISKESEFYMLFYNKDFDKALIATNFMLSHELTDAGKFRADKFLFYKACVFFSQEKIKEASELIRNSLEIEKDKTGWNVQLRLLSIMILIEQSKMDEVSFSIESLRKFIERAKTDKEILISERDRQILVLLKEWEKIGFTKRVSETKINAILDQLAEKGKPHSWNHFSNELIQFHTWMKEKIK